MASLVSVLFGFTAVGVFADPDSYNNLGEIVFTHVLFRHGQRMPLEFYPNDPHKDSPIWPNGVAQLTDLGKQQEYELGQWLRRRYRNLLSDLYNAAEIYVQSTDTDRTLMSAQCSMTGLYNWQPIPIHTIPVEADSLLGATSTCRCPAYDAELKRATSLPEVRALQDKFEAMYNHVSNHSGNEVRDFTTAVKIYDALSIEEQYNMSLPEWALAIYPEPIREAGMYSFVLPTWTTLLQRLKVGPLLKDMVQHFKAKRDGTLAPNRRVWVYSAHDATIAALLNTLKVFDIHYPPYAACVVLELRLIIQDYFVTLSYRNSTAEEPVLLPIKTCSSVCPLDQFVSLVQPLLPDNWSQECQLPVSRIDTFIWPAIISVCGIVGCFILIALTTLCVKNSTTRNYQTMTSALTRPVLKTNPSLDPCFMYPLPK